MPGLYSTALAVMFVLNVTVHSFKRYSKNPPIKGFNMLHTAALEGCVAPGEMLIALGMKADEDNSSGEKAVHIAARNGKFEFLQMLSRNGVKMNGVNAKGETPLYLFAKTGQPGSGRILIHRLGKFDLNEAPDASSRTPLHWAVANGNMDLVKALVEAGASVNRRASNGDTPLDLAIMKNWKDIVSYLKERDAETKNVEEHLPNNWW